MTWVIFDVNKLMLETRRYCECFTSASPVYEDLLSERYILAESQRAFCA